MWRRVYLLLALVRLYLALQPSYLHPDEHFQGPEVIAGRILSFPTTRTWEFTSATPIRSFFALWPVYGLPMLILKWLAEGFDNGEVSPLVISRALRFVMYMFSFVLEDWAIHDLVETRQQRRVALMLVASSYVTWTWQAHTFSNAVETVVVLWSIVLIKRLVKHEAHFSTLKTTTCLAVLLVFGTFNRITFPVFVMVPLVRLALRRPSTLPILAAAGVATTVIAIVIDTAFYSTADQFSLTDLVRHPVIAPLNSLLYNTQSANLALHGTHPPWQHFFVNLPQLLGPAVLLLLTSPVLNIGLGSALAGTYVLSTVPHQEARFLLPAIPLILSSVRLPANGKRIWIASWIIFNCIFGLLMGVYHQGGIVEAQAFVRSQNDIGKAFWWKTYSPPTWILGQRNVNIETVDLMGLRKDLLEETICNRTSNAVNGTTILIAPESAIFLDNFQNLTNITAGGLSLQPRWTIRNHLNLDDMDFGEDGFLPTLSRVIGRRGITVFDVTCYPTPARNPPNNTNKTISTL